MSELLLVLLIALFGALVRTVFGFGEALVTMPLLALIGFDLPTGTALIGALGLMVALPAAIRSHATIDWRVVRRLVTGSLAGIPVGIWLVKAVPSAIVLRGLGSFLLIYGGYSLWRARRHRLGRPVTGNGWDFLAGFIAGGLGSAYNSHGVPVAVYGTLKQWSPEVLRGTLQAHFLCVGVLVVASQIAAGFWNQTVIELLAMLILPLAAVIWLGNRLFQRLPKALLVQAIDGLLMIFGVLLICR